MAAILLAPIQIIVGIIMMYYFIGIAFLAGIGIMLITILCTFMTAKKSYGYNKKILNKKDERMKVTQ